MEDRSEYGIVHTEAGESKANTVEWIERRSRNMHNEGFRPDKTFDSLDEAYQFISNRYALRQPVCLELEHPSGLTILTEAPMYLFRGEPGRYNTTLSSVERRETFSLRMAVSSRVPIC